MGGINDTHRFCGESVQLELKLYCLNPSSHFSSVLLRSSFSTMLMFCFLGMSKGRLNVGISLCYDLDTVSMLGAPLPSFLFCKSGGELSDPFSLWMMGNVQKCGKAK